MSFSPDVPPPCPPVAHASLVREAHGERWQDEHAWLRAEDWQRVMRDPAALPDDIRRWLEAENAHAEALFEPLASLRADLLAELRGRIEPREESLPDDIGPWRYLERLGEGDEHGACLRAPRPDGSPDRGSEADGCRGESDAGGGVFDERLADERVILDLEAESEGSDCFGVGSVEPSPDHRHLAWTVDEDGAELYRLLIRDLDALEDVEEIEEVGDVAWATAEVLFYTRLDEALRPSRVYRHVLGTDPDEDVLVHEEGDERFECWVGTSRSREYVFIGAEMSDTSEVRFVPTADPFAEPALVEPRTPGLEYSVEHRGARFVILANADGAIDFALFETSRESPGRAHWRTLVEHVPGRTILDVHVCGEWLVWIEREEALPRIRWQGADGTARAFDVDEAAYSLSLEPLAEFETEAVRIGYSSPTTPERVYEVDLSSGARRLVKAQRIPSGHDPDRYRTARVTATSADGSEVPVTLLHRADTPLDGTAPCLLYVYGAYGSSVPAAFDAGQLPLVDRGFVHVIAHVRGGQERGRAWYEGSRFGGARARDRGPRCGRRDARRDGCLRTGTHRAARGVGRRARRRCRAEPRGVGAERPLGRGDHGRAVRRCAEHHARRLAAADARRVVRVGQPDREPRGLRGHPTALAVRQHRARCLPTDARHRRHHRLAGDVVGACEVGGPVARAAHGRGAARAVHQPLERALR